MCVGRRTVKDDAFGNHYIVVLDICCIGRVQWLMRVTIDVSVIDYKVLNS